MDVSALSFFQEAFSGTKRTRVDRKTFYRGQGGQVARQNGRVARSTRTGFLRPFRPHPQAPGRAGTERKRRLTGRRGIFGWAQGRPRPVPWLREPFTRRNRVVVAASRDILAQALIGPNWVEG